MMDFLIQVVFEVNINQRLKQMVYLKTDEEVELLRAANLLVGQTLAELAKIIQPGVTTRQLDAIAETFIRDHGAVPTFKGFPNPNGDAHLRLCQSSGCSWHTQ